MLATNIAQFLGKEQRALLFTETERESLVKVVREGVNFWLENNDIENPLMGIQSLAKIDGIDLFDDKEKLEKRIRQIHLDAKFLSKGKGSISSVEAVLLALYRGIIEILDTIFSIFGWVCFFEPPENAFEEQNRGYFLMGIASSISLLSHQILPLIGIEEKTKEVGASVLGIGIASLIYQKFKPCPHFLPRGENWSDKARESQEKVFQGNREYLDQIAASLINKKKVLVLGESGVGKTETVRSFIKSVQQGDYPELREKTFFYFNTADLHEGDGKKNILSWLEKKIGRHQENVVIIFDEIHALCQGVLTDRMKTALDDRFPYFIGMTTKEEYTKFIENQKAFVRRFEKLEVKRPDDDELLKTVLPDLIRSEMPEAIIEGGEDTVKYLIEQTRKHLKKKEAPYQVDHTLEVLRYCFELTSESEQIKVDTKITSLKKKIQECHSLRTLGSPLAIGNDRELEDLTSSLSKRTEKVKSREKEKAVVFRRRKDILAAKNALYEIALRVDQLSREDRVAFYLIQEVLYPALVENLKKRAKSLKLRMIIDKDLIDQAISKVTI